MNKDYKFFIAGRTRNKENILKICNIFDELNITHYCFLKNEKSHNEAGLDINDNHLADTFEALKLESPSVRTIFENDLEGEQKSENFLDENELKTFLINKEY